MTKEDLFQRIFNELHRYLPENWNKVVAYFEYGEESYSFSFFVKEKGQYTKCYDLPGVSESDLMELFSTINIFLGAERNKDKSNLWSTMTMTIEVNGHMKADYDYCDLSGGTYLYKKNWKRKYLI